MPTVLVRNGRIVTASESYEADLYVDGGRIALLGQSLSLPADTVVDASGCLVLPGGIDVPTHLDHCPFTTSDKERGRLGVPQARTRAPGLTEGRDLRGEPCARCSPLPCRSSP